MEKPISYQEELLNKLMIKDISKYDVIGFDVDHCLAEYNVRNLHQMTYKGMTDTLINDFSYPKSIQDLTPDQMNFSRNGSVFDSNTGYILKLGENNIVLRAYYGFTKLARHEIEKTYGNPPLVTNYVKEKNSHNGYWTFYTFFDSALMLMVAAGTELIKKKEIDKTPAQLFADARAAYIKNYTYWDAREMKKLDTYGNFYPAVVKAPHLYLQKREMIRELLVELRKKGKGLFLASNSNFDYCELIMSNSFGFDWRSLFDFCISGARKPSLFTESNPFLKVDPTKHLFLGEEVKTPLTPGCEYVQGNSKDLEKSFEELLKKKSLKFLYVGDHYMSDCYSSSKLDNWDSLAVVEEFLYECNLPRTAGPLLEYQSYWGSHFYEELEDGTKVPTLWTIFFSREIIGIVPTLEYLISITKLEK